MAKVYTKTGDQGETSLLDGQRVSKTHSRIEAYGTVDELNAFIGLTRSKLSQLKNQPNLDKHCQKLDNWLTEIQHQLFNIGSHLSCPPSHKAPLPPLQWDQVEVLEKIIDECQAHLSPLKNFILPYGCEVASLFHISRTITRRAERAILRIDPKDKIAPEILPYLNRLSDLFFVLARYANHMEGHEETKWALR